MLVCSIALRPALAAISATVAEATTATDATAQGQIVFATLVDDPANVLDTVDAYLGEIMEEAAAAADSFDAGLEYAAAVDEAETAGDTLDATVGIAAVPRDAMVPGVMVNSDGNARQANARGIMINL